MAKEFPDITDDSSGVIYDNTPDDHRPSQIETPLGDKSRGVIKVTENGSDALDRIAAGDNADTKVPDDVEKDEPEENVGDTASAAAKKASDDATAAQKAKDDAAAAPKPIEKVTDKLTDTAPKEPADKLADIQVSDKASTKTKESFSKLKELSRAEIASRDARIKELETKVPKGDSKLPVDVEKELTELRTFRTAFDFENTSEFKKTYVAPIEEAETVVRTKLKASGMTDEQIAKIDAIGLSKLDWDPVLKGLPTLAARQIEQKLLEIESLSEKKEKALGEAKKNPTNYLESQKQSETQRTAQDSALKETMANEILSKTDWFKEKPIPAGATTEEKASIESDNAFIKEQQKVLKDILSDPSPGMFGTLAASTVLAYKFKRDMEHFKARAEAAETKLKGITKASRFRDSGTNSPGSALPEKKSLIIRKGSEALDDLAKEVQG